ncbi:sarcosine oxidase subunit alpha family protein [Roseitranquillus sediminis]|uniref:sarcosine oxidase subunit alpha family protein n=1 Tax=Roseitranquillus sediminis TaxID=2809051 RepID=UPI001D0C508C|nr:sarcosine oxidase subunit alpha family protein [Roseitranquillus sediminis]MBM9594322.1 sarcosine oxidase subunit alpha family protein [Roseitranquillus sediminis]
MSTRLGTGGSAIDRSRPVHFTFDGRRLAGLTGDTVASALLANGERVVGRSFKYHRPRGIVASGPEEPNALLGIGTGDRFEPNARATTTPLREGMALRSQNRWPSLAFDVGVVNAALSRFLPVGFYYKTFMWPRRFWESVYEPLIRQAAGLGRAPDAETRDPDRYEHFHLHVDVLVAGGGIAGLQSALAAGRAGAQVLLMEQSPHWGGRAQVDGVRIEGDPAAEWVARAVAELEAMPNVRLRLNATVVGAYDHGWMLAVEMPEPGPRERLWKIRARRTVMATGALERPLAFAGNDRPGVMLASAVRDNLMRYAVSPGDRTVLVTANDDGYRTAIALVEAGLSVPLVVDARPECNGPLPRRAREMGIRVAPGRAIAGVRWQRRITGVDVCLQAGEGSALEHVPCDAVAMAGGWSPAVHLWSHCGGRLRWDEATAAFRPDPQFPPTGADGQAAILPAGSADGHSRAVEVLASAHRAGVAGAAAAAHEGDAGQVVTAEEGAEAPALAVWRMPQSADHRLRAQTFLDFQNDVKLTDVELAAQEGYRSVEHAKRYTTLGMATDQGKLSNINGLAALSHTTGQAISAVGTTTFRPPYTPLTLATIAGQARGDLFQPVRRTPLHARHEALGAAWEPVGQWRRPYVYPKAGETVEDAVRREVLAVRSEVGILDATTLGKIIVKGPDAAQFLDMIYTGRPSTIAEGRCRYGLICNENGFLIDDGVVARLGPETWLCHTTTGGAERIHAHMEEWLQTEWWDWRVHVLNVTEQFGQIAVAGPLARNLLERLGGMDLSREALPFMHWTEGRLMDVPVRVFRISFSGELSFEIAAPAGRAGEIWDRLAQDATPYGTETMHVLRAEKGYIMIGDETDGTVIPQDLGLNWAIAKKKDDYIGKRGQMRLHMAGERWRLVGLLTPDGAVLPEGSLAVAQGTNANGQRRTQGRVTSAYWSPTLGRGIALGLVDRGPERMGETLSFLQPDGSEYRAEIVSPVFHDPEGERLNA